ncbi:MAG: nucleoside phosphorylase [Firmicutes bacterium]|nr:nucleoside phosphorylase [Bacillota bacterium]
MSIIDTFDPERRAVLNPEDVYKPVEGFPDTVLVTFSKKIIDIALEMYECSPCAWLYAGEKVPVYCFETGNCRLGIIRTHMGAPMTVALMEELIAMGGRQFVFFGSCGTLDASIPAGHLIVPEAAYRDEGTSYHYMPASAGDFVNIPTAETTAGTIEDMGIPVIRTKVWTTDGLYRETRANMAKRVAEGCRVVDMECSAIMAAAAFRGVRTYQFLYAEDNLDAVEWDPRTMGRVPASASELYLRTAVETGCRVNVGKDNF